MELFDFRYRTDETHPTVYMRRARRRGQTEALAFAKQSTERRTSREPLCPQHAAVCAKIDSPCIFNIGKKLTQLSFLHTILFTTPV